MVHDRTIRLVLVGDLMFNGDYLLPPNDDREPAYYFSGVRDLFESADISFCNLESTLFGHGSPIRPGTGFHLRSQPEKMIPILEYLGINVVSLGNNHMDDFGAESLIETKRFLLERGFAAFGVGETADEARKPAVVSRGGAKIAFLGYTTNTASDGVSPDIGSAIATGDSPGSNYYALERIREDIDCIRNDADILCISLHWGHEYFRYPSPKQIELAHAIIDAGADIIIGHHPHCLQGIEYYKEGLILYSLGNFFFLNHHKRLGYPLYGNGFTVAVCELTGKRWSVSMVPGEMGRDNRLRILERRDEFDERLEEYSRRLTEPEYGTFWSRYRTETDGYLERIALEHASTLIESPADIPAILRKIKQRGLSGAIERLRYKLRARSKLRKKK